MKYKMSNYMEFQKDILVLVRSICVPVFFFAKSGSPSETQIPPWLSQPDSKVGVLSDEGKDTRAKSRCRVNMNLWGKERALQAIPRVSMLKCKTMISGPIT